MKVEEENNVPSINKKEMKKVGQRKDNVSKEKRGVTAMEKKSQARV